MKRTWQISNGIALLITIAINYLSNTGIFDGNTVASISDRYQNYFTPAGYAFSIWGLIYVSLICFVIYQGRSLYSKTEKSNIVERIGWWFVISCLANGLWIIAWLYQYTGLSVLIMALLLFSLMKIVVRTSIALNDVSSGERAFVWWPFSLYSGWITVAFIADMAAWLTKIKWSGFGISAVGWTVIMICAAGVINLFMTWKRNMRIFSLVGVWALTAIAVSNWNGQQSVVRTALIVAVVLLVSTGIHFQRRRRIHQ